MVAESELREICRRHGNCKVFVLSNRELQIARLIAEGLPNGEISRQLAITERTIKIHLSSIFAKTGTKGRLSLALLMKKGGND